MKKILFFTLLLGLSLALFTFGQEKQKDLPTLEYKPQKVEIRVPSIPERKLGKEFKELDDFVRKNISKYPSAEFFILLFNKKAFGQGRVESFDSEKLVLNSNGFKTTWTVSKDTTFLGSKNLRKLARATLAPVTTTSLKVGQKVKDFKECGPPPGAPGIWICKDGRWQLISGVEEVPYHYYPIPETTLTPTAPPPMQEGTSELPIFIDVSKLPTSTPLKAGQKVKILGDWDGQNLLAKRIISLEPVRSEQVHLLIKSVSIKDEYKQVPLQETQLNKLIERFQKDLQRGDIQSDLILMKKFLELLKIKEVCLQVTSPLKETQLNKLIEILHERFQKDLITAGVDIYLKEFSGNKQFCVAAIISL